MAAPTAPAESGSSVLLERAPAKVNLCLHVTGRKADGYHMLDSLVAFADIGDEVVVSRRSDATILQVVCGEMPVVLGRDALVVPAGTDNLAWRALAALARETGRWPGVEVTLRKRLPAGAGLGGGSSDAAAVIRAVAALLGQADARPLRPVALGADLPMCLDPRPWRARGVGEVLEPLVLAHDLPALLVWPGRPLSTPAVFRARTGGFGAGIPAAAVARLARDPLGTLAELRNDLEPAACTLDSAVAEALEAVRRQPRCRLARMSGSGSAVFGLFERESDVAEAAAALASENAAWWVRATVLRAGRMATRVAGER